MMPKHLVVAAWKFCAVLAIAVFLADLLLSAFQ